MAGGNSVEVILSVNDIASIKSIKALTREVDRLKNKLAEAGEKSAKSNSAMVNGLNSVSAKAGQAVKSIAGIAAGYMSAKAAIDLLISSQNELNVAKRDKGIQFDEAFRKFGLQAGIQGPQLMQAQEQIGQQAVTMSMDPIEVAGIAEQLVSSGFDKDQASGPALLSALKLMAGTNQAMTARGDTPVSTKDLIQATSSYLENLGLDKTAESIDRFAVAAQSAFKSTNLQLEDFLALAPESAVMRGVLPMEQQVAFFSKIRDTNPSGPESATSLRNIVLRTTAITEPTRIEALKKAGLEPKDVDAIGEDFMVGMKKLRAGLQHLPEEEQRKVAKIMYEERGVAPFMTLMQPGVLEDIEQRQTKFSDKQQYEKDVTIATSGKSAQARREKAKEDIRIGTAGQNEVGVQELLTAARSQAVEEGNSELWADVKKGIASWAVWGGQISELVGLGVKPETTTSLVFGGGLADATGEGPAMEFRTRLNQRLNKSRGDDTTFEKNRDRPSTRTPAERVEILRRISQEIETTKDITPEAAGQFRQRITGSDPRAELAGDTSREAATLRQQADAIIRQIESRGGKATPAETHIARRQRDAQGRIQSGTESDAPAITSELDAIEKDIRKGGVTKDEQPQIETNRLLRQLIATMSANAKATEKNTDVTKQNSKAVQNPPAPKPVQQAQPAQPQPKKRAEPVVAKMQSGTVGVR